MIIGIGGQPATGKSTLMRGLIEKLGQGWPFKTGLVSGTLYRNDTVAVLGHYAPDDKFPGTDRLSMAASPAVLAWLQMRKAHTVLFEGDRLFTSKVINECSARSESCHFFMLVCPPDQLTVRHSRRGDKQSATFLKGRVTKYRNIADRHSITYLSSMDRLDFDYNVELISVTAGI